MTKDEALDLMLNALELIGHIDGEVRSNFYAKKTIDLVKKKLNTKETLAQPEQEPVAWRYRSVSPFVGKDGTYKVSDGWTLIREPEKRDAHSAMCGMEAEPLYTTPPHRKPLTDEEIDAIPFRALEIGPTESFREFARAIEAAHGIKE